MTAESGRAGVETALRHRPDLVLLDLNLPDISGLRVLETLREAAGMERVPIIIVSADATKGRIATLMAAGANDYVTKPPDLDVLLRAVDNALDVDGTKL